MFEQTFLYVVRNSDGQYFRRKGYGGHGKTWVDSIDTARIYAKIGQARSIVTFFANSYPQYPAPTILKLGITTVEVINETERIQKAKEKKQKEEENRRIRDAQYRLEQAQRELDAAKRGLT